MVQIVVPSQDILVINLPLAGLCIIAIVIKQRTHRVVFTSTGRGQFRPLSANRFGSLWAISWNLNRRRDKNPWRITINGRKSARHITIRNLFLWSIWSRNGPCKWLRSLRSTNRHQRKLAVHAHVCMILNLHRPARIAVVRGNQGVERVRMINNRLRRD